MTCTLDLYTDYLLSSTGPTTATGLSRLLDGALSHDHITRWLSQGTYGPAEVWRQAKPLIRQAEARRPAEEFAVLIVDDSVLEKAHTDANELICTHWDHRQQRYVKGLNFVTLLYQAGELAQQVALGGREVAGWPVEKAQRTDVVAVVGAQVVAGVKLQAQLQNERNIDPWCATLVQVFKYGGIGLQNGGRAQALLARDALKVDQQVVGSFDEDRGFFHDAEHGVGHAK